MRHLACTWLALSSFAVFTTLLSAATRPRYGGTLTIQLAAAFPTLDPAEAADTKGDAIGHLLFETLVTINAAGDAQPLLATAWQHDAQRKRWRFTLRPKVVFHDGKPLTASSALPSLQAGLKKRYGQVTVSASAQTVFVQSDNNLDDLLAELSLPRNAIFRRGDNNDLIGTGPFRLDKWEPGRKAIFAAFEDYWAGRPYVDSVIVNLGPVPRQLPANGADIWELPISGTRRVLPDTLRTWTSSPTELVAIQAVDAQPAVREALALAVDRAPIVNVLAQRRGVAAGGLLPQWLTGYAFLFSAAADQPKARQILASLRSGPLTISYPADDSFARSVADRVSLNARDVGLTVQPTTSANANLRLVRVPLPSPDAALDLAELATTLGLPRLATSLEAGNTEALYQSELALLGEHKIIPLIHLPAVFGIGPRVHDWDASQNGRAFVLHLENVWLSP